jgi:hypothetical protein
MLQDELKRQGWINEVELSPMEEYEIIITNLKIMRTHYKDYSIETARNILKAIPKAYDDCKKEGGRWGPGRLAGYCYINATTIGRYLKAFRSAGLMEVEVSGEIIPIP